MVDGWLTGSSQRLRPPLFFKSKTRNKTKKTQTLTTTLALWFALRPPPDITCLVLQVGILYSVPHNPKQQARTHPIHTKRTQPAAQVAPEDIHPSIHPYTHEKV